MNSVKSIVLISVLYTFLLSCTDQKQEELNTISFEKSDYGLIFTIINIKDQSVRAMIDFGDQHKLQLSSKIVKELNLPVQKTDYKVSDVLGNTWDVFEGELEECNIGSWKESGITFTMQEGEMEAVSQQIGTEFNAVVGWGYFKDYYTEIDYKNNTFRLQKNFKPDDPAVFSIPFTKDASQLLITATVEEKQVKLMIDTGSPVSVLDSAFKEELTGEDFNFQLGGNAFELMVYPQDLSVLADLGVVGILGGDFLKDWRVIIDPVEHELHFFR